jgi:hypothetical protein
MPSSLSLSFIVSALADIKGSTELVTEMFEGLGLGAQRSP